MKTLVLYYSFEGNTELIAKAVAETLGADLERLMPEKEIGTHGFMKYFWGGRQAVMKEKPALKPIQHRIEDYDLIVLGSPTWAYTFSPPIRTFLATQSFKDKKVAFLLCHGGGPRNALSDFAKAAEGAIVVGSIDFRDPLKHDTEIQLQKARDWAKSLLVAQ
jgi:flavodoxin